MAALPVPEDLRDDLVILRPFAPRDAHGVFAACQDPLIDRFTTFAPPRDKAEALNWIAGQPEQRRRGAALDLAVVDRAGRLMGAVGLGDVLREHRRGNAGYWVAPEARGRGIAARALHLLATWALSPPLDLVRVELHIDSENAASRRTAERAGFACEGVLRSYMRPRAAAGTWPSTRV
jgi:RimJ/RimL family protein N-acetyltransferase